MYIFAYSSGPAPDCTTLSHIIETSSINELITEIRDTVLYESLEMMCADPPELPEDSIQDIIRTLATEEEVNDTFLNAVQVLLKQLDSAQTSQAQEDLNACVQAFNQLFDEDNFTDWEFGIKLIADDCGLADFITGDMGPYCDCREEAELILNSHRV